MSTGAKLKHERGPEHAYSAAAISNGLHSPSNFEVRFQAALLVLAQCHFLFVLTMLTGTVSLADKNGAACHCPSILDQQESKGKSGWIAVDEFFCFTNFGTKHFSILHMGVGESEGDRVCKKCT
jgi:hypothetical protein